jgi:hypothetical protein
MEDEVGRLRAYRKLMKDAMVAFIHCRGKVEEKALRQEWKSKYGKVMYEQLVRLSKDRQARLKVSQWNVDKFDTGRINAKR